MHLKGLRRKTALIMAFLFVLAALTACGQKGRLRIGTAGEGGNYNSLGKALCKDDGRFGGKYPSALSGLSGAGDRPVRCH